MNPIEHELNKLKEGVVDMMKLVRKQSKKAKKAFLEMDSNRAEEVIHTEKRVNAMELSIDRECENIFALHQPVASDLRFLISALKINSDLERIGDYAEGTAKNVLDIQKVPSNTVIAELQMEKLFEMTIEMIESMQTAFNEENVDVAMKLFKKDKELNKITKIAIRKIVEIIEKEPQMSSTFLYLFSTIKKLERTGDHIKNIAEEIIFSIEAKVLKHQSKKNK